MPNSALSLRPASIEWFKEDQAFSPSYDSAPHPPTSPIYRQQAVPLSQSSCMCVACQAYLREGKGVGSQIKWPRESLALYKSFNTLWLRWNGLQCGKGRCWGVIVCFKNVGFVENQKCHFLYLSSILFASSLFFCLLEQDSIFFLN